MLCGYYVSSKEKQKRTNQSNEISNQQEKNTDIQKLMDILKLESIDNYEDYLFCKDFLKLSESDLVTSKEIENHNFEQDTNDIFCEVQSDTVFYEIGGKGDKILDLEIRAQDILIVETEQKEEIEIASENDEYIDVTGKTPIPDLGQSKHPNIFLQHYLFPLEKHSLSLNKSVASKTIAPSLLKNQQYLQKPAESLENLEDLSSLCQRLRKYLFIGKCTKRASNYHRKPNFFGSHNIERFFCSKSLGYEHRKKSKKKRKKHERYIKTG